MIMFDHDGNVKRVNEYIYNIVKDLEQTRWKYHGYSYVRTIRNILIGKADAAIAPFFVDKGYHGIFKDLTLGQVEFVLDSFVETGYLECVHTDHGKLYCTKEYHDYLCNKGR